MKDTTKAIKKMEELVKLMREIDPKKLGGCEKLLMQGELFHFNLAMTGFYERMKK